MGFTIGGIRQTRAPRPTVLRPGGTRQDRHRVQDAVTEYADRWGWPVVPGARATKIDGRLRCSCGRANCLAPGAHPLAGDPAADPGPDRPPRRGHTPSDASVMLAVGRRFDVLEIAESAAHHAVARLERMGLPLGPVAVTPHHRAWFLVAPGACADLPDLLYRMGWEGVTLDLRGLGPGQHIAAPPSDLGGLGPVRWLRAPTAEGARRPPPARLLLGTLAYVCHRVARGLNGVVPAQS
ncbi:DNA primase [Streptomyces sp. NPDC005438]|uniref:bifunctional DNA primase/polymerase n=1 Tax=Streptomyces sp. NPDC005438 TaxID=3156880 RepID=UPI0033B88A8F